MQFTRRRLLCGLVPFLTCLAYLGWLAFEKRFQATRTEAVDKGQIRETRTEAVYKGQSATYWRSLMEWNDVVADCDLVAFNFPLLRNPDPEAIPVLLELLDYREDHRVQLTARDCLGVLNTMDIKRALPGLCRIIDAH